MSNLLLEGCLVHTRDGREKQVKNLGYLLRRWREIVGIRLWTRIDGKTVKIGQSPFEGCLLVARFSNGDSYSCPWADCEHCVAWLHRPVLYGLRFQVDHEAERIIEGSW